MEKHFVCIINKIYFKCTDYSTTRMKNLILTKKKKNNFGHCENNVGDKPRVIRMIHFKRLLLFIIQQASNLLYDTVLLFFGGLKKKKWRIYLALLCVCCCFAVSIISSHSIFPSPLPGQLVVFFAVGLVYPCYFRDQGIIRIGVAKKRADRQEN